MVEAFKRRMKESTGREPDQETIETWLSKLIDEKVEREFAQTFSDQSLGTLLNCRRALFDEMQPEKNQKRKKK